MKTSHKVLLLTFALACLALPAEAADRMRAGQWVGVTTMPGTGKTIPTSTCLSQSDADAMNGDAKSVRNYLEKVIPPEACKLSDIQLIGSQVIYTGLRRRRG